MTRKTGALLGILWLFLFAAGLWLYPGSKVVYSFFSFSFLCLLISGFYRQKTYGYLFLASFLWLGFWFKHIFHLLVNYAYIEPVGSFDAAPASWDAVLVTAAVGSLGVIAARMIYRLLSERSTLKLDPVSTVSSSFYDKWRLWLWVASLSGLAVVAIINSYLGIHRIGLVAHTVLPWHLNGLIAWVLNIGAAIVLAVLFYREAIAGGKIALPLLGVICGACISSVSTFSRGTFIYLAVPAVFAAFYNMVPGKGFSLRRPWVLLFAAAILFGMLFAVTTFRSRNYTVKPEVSKSAIPTMSAFWEQVRPLAVDRWVGLEGLMALSALPEKNRGIFLKALTEKRTTDGELFYEQVSNSNYRKIDRTKLQFGTLPGSVAFFFYSGSLFFVFFGMFLLASGVLFLERAVWASSKNPFLCALIGMTLASTAAQLGTAPSQMLPHLAMTSFVILLIWAAQTVTGVLAGVEKHG